MTQGQMLSRSLKQSLRGAPNRTRMINFRVSDEELDALLAAARRSGSRSVSSYIRQQVIAKAYEEPLLELEFPASDLQASLAEQLLNLLRAVEGALNRNVLKVK